MLYSTQMSRHRTSAADGTTWSPVSETPLNDLDRIAGESRDTGQLAEPLADSVLEYGLRKLKPNANPAAVATHGLEKPLYPDELSQLLDERAQNLSVPLATTAVQFPQAAMDLHRSGESYFPQTNEHMWNRVRTPPVPPAQGSNYDFWQFSLDGIQEPVMPYDDMLGMDFSF